MNKIIKIGLAIIGLLINGGVYAECVADVIIGGNLPRESNPSICYRNGERHGHWIERWANGIVTEGPMVNGKANGHWVEYYGNGTSGEGPIVNGEPHGHWVLYKVNGDAWLDIEYDNGEIVDTNKL